MQANFGFTPKMMQISEITDCDIAAPTNLYLVDEGGTWLSVAWTAPPGYGGNIYNIKVLLQGNIIQDYNVTGTQTTINNLNPGTLYTIRVSAVCYGNNEEPVSSRNYAEIEGHTLILVVDLNNTPIPQEGDYYYMLSSCISFPVPTGNIMWIQIKEKFGSNSYYHPVRYVNYGLRIGKSTSAMEVTRHRGVNDMTMIEPTAAGEWVDGAFIYIGEPSNPVPIVLLTTPAGNATPPVLCGTLANTAYSFQWVIKTTGFAPPGSGNRNGAESPEATTFIPLNPFGASLEILESNISDHPVYIRLFDLNGRLLLDEDFPAEYLQYSLPTETLPTGVYILQIISNGVIQTYKVLKSS